MRIDSIELRRGVCGHRGTTLWLCGIIVATISWNVPTVADTAGALAREQAEKLVKAAWKEPPRSIDVTYRATVWDLTKTRCRIRFDGNRLRVDRDEALDANEPFETSSIYVTDQNGVTELYVYSYNGRSASRQVVPHREIFQEGQDSRIVQFGLIPVAALLRMELGTREEDSRIRPHDYTVDPNKVEQLCAGTLPALSARIQPDTNEPNTRDRIELTLYNAKHDPVIRSTLMCSRQDYSRVYRFEARALPESLTVQTISCDDFDAQGFPHSCASTTYDNQGKIRLQETYKIEKVSVNVPVPDKVFQFDPPKGYIVTDSTLSPEEQQAAQIAGWKEWLTHESWTDRIQALKALEGLLEDKPEELKAIATAMKDDKQAQVRMAAADVLKHLEASK